MSTRADRGDGEVPQTEAPDELRRENAGPAPQEPERAVADLDQSEADWEHANMAATTLAAEMHEASRRERNAVSRELDSTAAARSKTTARRLATASQRDDVARTRDRTAAARDRTARTRDQAAGASDDATIAPDHDLHEAGDAKDALATIKALRISVASVRRHAEGERSAAAADRGAAAADREAAAEDRRVAGVDELTGVFRRGAGELTLTHEIDRSRRTKRSLVLAIIDIDGLKVVNDNQGHQAGDMLLRDVAAAITSTLRSYDVTVRWGGDEFICALSDVTLMVAPERVAEIQRALDARRPGASISAGFAELDDDDDLETLIARADSALYRAKANRET